MIIVSALVALIVATGVIVCADDNSTSANPSMSINSIDVSGISVIEQPTKDYDIVIFGTTIPESVVSTISLPTANMVSLAQYDSNKPILSIMCESWLVKDDVDSIKLAKDMLSNGSAVAVLNSSFDWKQLDVSMSIPMGQANVVAVFPTTSGTSSFSCICDSDEDAMNRLMKWADSTIRDDNLSVMSSKNYDADFESIHDYQSSGYGWTSVRTIYYKLTDNSDEYDYYLGEYNVSMEPDSGSFVSGLDVQSSMDNGIMLRHGPTTTQGTSTAGVDLTYSAGASGLSVGVGASWTYSVQDIIVYDHTSVRNNILDIDHDVAESKAVGKTTCTVEPGKLVRVSASDSYHSVDTYKSQFCHQYFGMYSAYNDTSASYEIIFR